MGPAKKILKPTIFLLNTLSCLFTKEPAENTKKLTHKHDKHDK